MWISAIAVGITGLGFLWAKYFVTAAEPWAVINHPLEPWFLKAHIVFAPALVFAVGLIATRHIVPHIVRGVERGRRSGLMMVWTLVPMVVSGYLIQVVTAAPVLSILVVLHIGSSVLFLAGIVVHGVVFALRARSPGAVRPDRACGPAPRISGAGEGRGTGTSP